MELKSMKINKMMDNEVVSSVGYSNKGLGEDKESEGECYPYCLKLYLGPDELKMLELKELPKLGSSIDLMAKVKVMSMRIEGLGNCLELQITDMALGGNKKLKNVEKMLYNEDESSEGETED
jgi:hypothetical protein